MTPIDIAKPDWKPLLSIAHARGTAAICHDEDDSYWLVDRLEDLDDEVDERVEDDEDEPDPREWFGDRMDRDVVTGMSTTTDGVHVIGGFLPPGSAVASVHSPDAVNYEVAASEGVWIAAAPSTFFRSPSVSFADQSGNPVAPSLPERVRLEPLVEASEPCPTCDAVAWGFASVGDSADESDWYVHEWQPGDRAMICTSCGFRLDLPHLSTGNSFEVRAPPQPASPEEIERRNLARSDHRRGAWQQIKSACGVTPLGLSAWSGSQRFAGGYGDGTGRYEGISLEFFHDNEDARSPSITASTGMLMPDDEPGLRDWTMRMDVASFATGRQLDLNDYESEHELRKALRLRSFELAAFDQPFERYSISVDDSPVDFRAIRLGACWIAIGEVGGAQITLTANGVEPSGIDLRSTEADEFA